MLAQWEKMELFGARGRGLEERGDFFLFDLGMSGYLRWKREREAVAAASSLPFDRRHLLWAFSPFRPCCRAHCVSERERERERERMCMCL